jgi:feruloyl esterase
VRGCFGIGSARHPTAALPAIRGEFIRQCDTLDGLADGIINNYMACRAIFDVTQGARNRQPWAAKRCPNNVDPSPEDTSASACLTDGRSGVSEAGRQDDCHDRYQ